MSQTSFIGAALKLLKVKMNKDVIQHIFRLCLLDEVLESDLRVAENWRMVNKDCNLMVRKHLKLQTFKFRGKEYFLNLSDSYAMKYTEFGWCRVRFPLRPNVYYRVGEELPVRFQVLHQAKSNRTPVSGEKWNQ